MDRRALLAGAATAGVASAAIPDDVLAASDRAEAIAATRYGRVRGIRSPDGVITFRGVPYGAPTSGSNRFMPPVKPEPWTGVREAVEWGQSAPQLVSFVPSEVQAYLGGPVARAQGEDCLVLNIWTQGLAAGRRRPVYVRIHGGGYSTGSGDRPMYLGHNTVRRGDVVYVSMNHRLDCFGFLDLSQFGGDAFAASANVGLLDLVAALEWVRDNIEHFGGDPDRVMIVGESGGGAKVSTLLGTPAAKGLFHRAVIESGPSLALPSRQTSLALAERFLKRAGIGPGQIGELQAIPAHLMLEARQLTLNRRWFPYEAPPQGGFGPIADGTIVPRDMFDPVATPISSDVPVIVGYNRDEGTFLQMADPDLYGLDDAGLEGRVRGLVGDAAPQVIAAYRDAQPNATPSELMIGFGTDYIFGANSIKLAERKAALGPAPVYLYRFDWATPAFAGKFGATHGVEIPFTAYNIAEMPVLTRDRPDAHALAAQVNDTWTAFAATGDPNGAGLPHWPAYTAQRRATLLIDQHSQVVDDALGPNLRRLWDAVPARRI
ncbi:MAG: carboxylesterase/lipase family protein [Phenylobacterium sp.]|uniref:carboxylesterase/lipase family protein n=1 Tax=Phenylobacterium sp. TaxID=1871053 RepID=UPI002733E74F|nr:carboxylesterase/lipase family protein [Phenylobacterium sp.]MDP3175792.1 carboxylesterase/lipase family protein [Phenylobacterium sp.]